MNKVLSADGTTIAYDKTGDGPLIILVLGALNRRNQGKKLAALLSTNFAVISYDRRGRGDSTDTLPYSIEREIEDIDALIEANGGSALIYGHSSGCVLALLAAESLQPKVKRLALYELPYNDDADARKEADAYQSRLSELLARDDRDAAVALFVRSVGVTDKQIAAMQRLPLWKGLTNMAQTLLYDTIELMRHYPTMDPSVAIPTLLMYGSASPEFMERTAISLKAKLPHARTKALEAQTHDVKAEVLAPVLIDFFQ